MKRHRLEVDVDHETLYSRRLHYLLGYILPQFDPESRTHPLLIHRPTSPPLHPVPSPSPIAPQTSLHPPFLSATRPVNFSSSMSGRTFRPTLSLNLDATLVH